ncbi:organic cation transporter protein-like [Centruroides sculpturatus]|uniref:organic cation transporter protein-like n=1 Tax=Centruroides sculpturatus TaxID=218467 RepID=UPI000C6EFB70|nr:organic cation transporter protein-like [Centruroides sculpturatus]
MENSKDIEDLTDLIGHYGKYQKLLLGLVIYVGIFSAFNNLNLPFLAPKIDYWCSRLPQYLNTSIEEWKNFSIPKEIRNGKHVYSKCEIYEETYRGHYSIDSPSVPCSSWEYDHSNYKSTITEQWGLVCENSWMISFAGSIYFVGFLITAFVSGQLSDRFGRRPVVLSCIIINSVFGITCTISPYYWMFATSRFLLSFGRAGLFLSWLILVVEIMGPKYRTRVSTSDKIGWATGQIILPGIAWLVKDWYYIQLASTLPVILLIFLWKYIPESPRWLLSHGKFHEADIIIRKIMKTNGKKVDELDVIIRKLAFKIKMVRLFEILKRIDRNGAWIYSTPEPLTVTIKCPTRSQRPANHQRVFATTYKINHTGILTLPNACTGYLPGIILTSHFQRQSQLQREIAPQVVVPPIEQIINQSEIHLLQSRLQEPKTKDLLTPTGDYDIKLAEQTMSKVQYDLNHLLRMTSTSSTTSSSPSLLTIIASSFGIILILIGLLSLICYYIRRKPTSTPTLQLDQADEPTPEDAAPTELTNVTPLPRSVDTNPSLYFFSRMVTVFAFYGLSFNADDTGGSVYLFYVLCGLMDYPSALLMQLLVVRIGRRYPLLVFLLISGICCIAASAIPDDMTWLRIVLAVSSKFCLSTALSILYIFSSEIYPTPVRNVGLGSCSMMGRIGAIIAPFMKQAVRILL